MKFFTYILKSLKDGRRYIGSTGDLESRIKAQNEGLTPATRNRRPFELLCAKNFGTLKEAMQYERYLKRLKGGNQLYKEIEQMKNNAVVAQQVEHLHGNKQVY